MQRRLPQQHARRAQQMQAALSSNSLTKPLPCGSHAQCDSWTSQPVLPALTAYAGQDGDGSRPSTPTARHSAGMRQAVAGQRATDSWDGCSIEGDASASEGQSQDAGTQRTLPSSLQGNMQAAAPRHPGSAPAAFPPPFKVTESMQDADRAPRCSAADEANQQIPCQQRPITSMHSQPAKQVVAWHETTEGYRELPQGS
jgi:hypothetical protein